MLIYVMEKKAMAIDDPEVQEWLATHMREAFDGIKILKKVATHVCKDLNIDPETTEVTWSYDPDLPEEYDESFPRRIGDIWLRLTPRRAA